MRHDSPNTQPSYSLLINALLLSAACGGPPEGETASTIAEARGDRPDLIECRSDEPCPRGSYCETSLGYCFTGDRCVVGGRPSDRYCSATFGDGFICHQYAPGSHHCVPTAPPPEPTCRQPIACRDDRACPRGSSCEVGFAICLTPSRCIVDGRPSTRFCQATYGDGFACLEYAPASWHCAPIEAGACRPDDRR
jgi:hypothetical protein